MLKILRAATFEVLETMFFLFPESAEGIDLEFQGPGLRAWVPVSGPQPFSIGITVPLELARELAANFLGVPSPEVSPEDLDDVMRELANMIVGAFLVQSRAAAVFRLTPPELQHLELHRRSVLENKNQILLGVGEYGLEVFLELGIKPGSQPRMGRGARGGAAPSPLTP